MRFKKIPFRFDATISIEYSIETIVLHCPLCGSQVHCDALWMHMHNNHNDLVLLANRYIERYGQEKWNEIVDKYHSPREWAKMLEEFK